MEKKREDIRRRVSLNPGEMEALRRVLTAYREQAPWVVHPLYDQLLKKLTK